MAMWSESEASGTIRLNFSRKFKWLAMLSGEMPSKFAPCASNWASRSENSRFLSMQPAALSADYRNTVRRGVRGERPNEKTAIVEGQGEVGCSVARL